MMMTSCHHPKSMSEKVDKNDSVRTFPPSYNIQRGEEAMQGGNYEEALVFFNKELKDSPQNGRAYACIAGIRAKSEDYGNALTAANMAIKYIPEEDKEYSAFAYAVRAAIYVHTSDTMRAIEDLSTAIKIDPEEPEFYDRRSKIYYNQKKYDLAVADYQKMIDLEPENVTGYMGKGYIFNEQKKWNEAVEVNEEWLKEVEDGRR